MNERIKKLNAEGHDTSWYDKSPRVKEQEAPQSCSRFSLYLLEGGASYTVNHDGTKYMLWKHLKRPTDPPQFYCSGCKKRWAAPAEWELALKHYEREG